MKPAVVSYPTLFAPHQAAGAGETAALIVFGKARAYALTPPDLAATLGDQWLWPIELSFGGNPLAARMDTDQRTTGEALFTLAAPRAIVDQLVEAGPTGQRRSSFSAALFRGWSTKATHSIAAKVHAELRGGPVRPMPSATPLGDNYAHYWVFGSTEELYAVHILPHGTSAAVAQVVRIRLPVAPWSGADAAAIMHGTIVAFLKDDTLRGPGSGLLRGGTVRSGTALFGRRHEALLVESLAEIYRDAGGTSMEHAKAVTPRDSAEGARREGRH